MTSPLACAKPNGPGSLNVSDIYSVSIPRQSGTSSRYVETVAIPAWTWMEFASHRSGRLLLRHCGSTVPVHVEAEEYTIPGLIRAMVGAVKAQ